ncbi:MAG TPA: biotin/lipoyl-containing protein, partial [Gemmatimonadaceae bacterium]|nr:biotin/lipoyl-containing protein [Gemmatimonadaceae bacterium]
AGALTLLRLPSGPGVRVDTGTAESDVPPPGPDTALAAVIGHGGSREEALARLARALGESAVVLEGGMGNRGLLLEIVRHPDLREGATGAGWLEGVLATREHALRPGAATALLAAALEEYERALEGERARFLDTASRGRGEVSAEVGRTVELSLRGTMYALLVDRIGPRAYRVVVDGRRIDVEVAEAGRGERWMTVDGTRHLVRSVSLGAVSVVEVDGVPHRVARGCTDAVRAPIPAVVVSVDVVPGDVVAVGDRVAVLEAMKMEITMTAHLAGRVREVSTRANAQVSVGAPLVLVEPDAEDAEHRGRPRVSFASHGVPADGAAEVDEPMLLGEARALMLGYDAREASLAPLLKRRVVPLGIDEALDAFVDVAAIFRRHRHDAPGGGTAPRLCAEECFHTVVRERATEPSRLPTFFVEQLRRALARYGVTSLEASPALDEALFRLARAHARVDEQARLVAAVLHQWLDLPLNGDSARWATDALRVRLDRLATETQRGFPALHELAREVRYRWFDQPLLTAARRRVVDDAEAELAALERTAADAAARAAHVEALVQCTQPIQALLSRRLAGVSSAPRRAMLEVMTRRYYRGRELASVWDDATAGRDVVRAGYTHRGVRVHAFAASAELATIAATLEAMRPALDAVPAEDEAVIDLYVWHEGSRGEPDAESAAAAELLEASVLPSVARRVVLVVASGDDAAPGCVRYYTFRREAGGPWAERLLPNLTGRDLHPMMAKRLHLWQLENFDLERLPSAEEVYLFRAVAKSNSKDERLIGVAEVRDLTPVRDAAGRVVGLPDLERMLLDVASSMRRSLSQRADGDRPHWNRILLYVWPPLALRADEMREIVRKLSPATDALGLDAVLVHARLSQGPGRREREAVLEVTRIADGQPVIRFEDPTAASVAPLTPYEQKVMRLRRRGLVYPYEIVRLLTAARDPGATPAGVFVEYDLDASGDLVPVGRPFGENTANIVVGVVCNFTSKHPEGLERVILLGDPTNGMGNLARPECARIDAALRLAARRGVPCEWFALSAGARIAMDSGTENMDDIALTLRRIIEYTQAGGELNLVVVGITVGAQPYWNAEATMLMHTKGVLIMTPDASMVLTGKQALDYSGSVSAEDNE